MNLKNLDAFQGNLEKKNYFEGWYYKVSSGDETYAFIPGVSLGDDSHAFLQIIDSREHQTEYIRYALDDFHYESGVLDIHIGRNRFTRDFIRLDDTQDSRALSGEFHFDGLTPFPARLFSPGIMGFFSFFPFMECNHGVVSVDHTVNGAFHWRGRDIRIEEGKGYIEKDWGRSMPSSWIWLQTNFFEVPGTSFMLSIARIPFLGSSFKGHLAYFHFQNQFFVFATYNGSRYEIHQNPAEKSVAIVLSNRSYRLEVMFKPLEAGGSLVAPVKGQMARQIQEQTDGLITLRFSGKREGVLFEGQGRAGGIEMTGAIDELC